MTKEEVKIAVGVDASQVGRDLGDIKKQFTAFQKDLKAQTKGLKDAFTFFGAGGIVNSVVAALTPATLAVSEFLGTLSVTGVAGQRAMNKVADAAEQTAKNLRKAREENDKLNKELQDLAVGNDQSKRDRRLDELSPMEKVNELQKQLNDAMIEENGLIGVGVEYEIEKQKRLAKGLKLSKEYADALKALDADRKQKAQEQKQRDKDEVDALQKKKDLQEKLVDLGKQANEARADEKKSTRDFNARRNSEYVPSLDQVAGRGGYYSDQAMELLRVQRNINYDASTLEGGFNNKFVKGEIDYADQLKKPFIDAGLLGPQETIAEATKASSKTLEGILKEQVKTTKLLEGDPQ